jgi:hypothetical protein
VPKFAIRLGTVKPAAGQRRTWTCVSSQRHYGLGDELRRLSASNGRHVGLSGLYTFHPKVNVRYSTSAPQSQCGCGLGFGRCCQGPRVLYSAWTTILIGSTNSAVTCSWCIPLARKAYFSVEIGQGIFTSLKTRWNTLEL